MAFEVPGFTDGTEVAAADLSAKQFFAVALGATGWALGGANEQGIGVLQNDPISGAAATVQLDGISKAVAGAAITKGAKLMTNAAGKLVTATIGLHIVAEAKAAAGADGDVIPVIIAYQGLAP